MDVPERVPRFEPAEKLVKNQRATSSSRNDMRVAYDQGYGPWLSRKFGVLLLEKSYLA